MNAPTCYVKGCTNPVAWVTTDESPGKFLCDNDRWRISSNLRKPVGGQTVRPAQRITTPVSQPETVQVTFKADNGELADELRIARDEGEGITIRVGGKQYTVDVLTVFSTRQDGSMTPVGGRKYHFDNRPRWMQLGFSSEADMRAEDFQD